MRSVPRGSLQWVWDGSMTRQGGCQSPVSAPPPSLERSRGELHGPHLPNRLCHGLRRHRAEHRRAPGIRRALGRAVPDQLTGQIHARPLCRHGGFSRPRRWQGRADPGPGPTRWGCRQLRPLHPCGPSVPAALPSLHLSVPAVLLSLCPLWPHGHPIPASLPSLSLLWPRGHPIPVSPWGHLLFPCEGKLIGELWVKGESPEAGVGFGPEAAGAEERPVKLKWLFVSISARGRRCTGVSH